MDDLLVEILKPYLSYVDREMISLAYKRIDLSLVRPSKAKKAFFGLIIDEATQNVNTARWLVLKGYLDINLYLLHTVKHNHSYNHINIAVSANLFNSFVKLGICNLSWLFNTMRLFKTYGAYAKDTLAYNCPDIVSYVIIANTLELRFVDYNNNIVCNTNILTYIQSETCPLKIYRFLSTNIDSKNFSFHINFNIDYIQQILIRESFKKVLEQKRIRKASIIAYDLSYEFFKYEYSNDSIDRLIKFQTFNETMGESMWLYISKTLDLKPHHSASLLSLAFINGYRELYLYIVHLPLTSYDNSIIWFTKFYLFWKNLSTLSFLDTFYKHSKTEPRYFALGLKIFLLNYKIECRKKSAFTKLLEHLFLVNKDLFDVVVYVLRDVKEESQLDKLISQPLMHKLFYDSYICTLNDNLELLILYITNIEELIKEISYCKFFDIMDAKVCPKTYENYVSMSPKLNLIYESIETATNELFAKYSKYETSFSIPTTIYYQDRSILVYTTDLYL